MTEAAAGRTETSFESGSETYRLVVLRGHEIEMISPLLVEVYGRPAFSPAWVRRKYACERDGVRSFACAALNREGRPVSVVGMLPWSIRYGDHVELGGQLADSSTSPAHQKRGLHVRLMHLAHDECASLGLAFVLRFSNQLSFAITTSKLGYTPLVDLVEYRRPVRTVWAERLVRRSGLGDAFYRRLERLTDPHLDDGPPPASSVLSEGYAGVERDRTFYEYKAAFGGSRVVNLEGARVWLAVRNGVLVGDVEAGSDEELDRGLDALDRLARRLGVRYVLYQASADVRLARHLATRLPETLRRPVSYFDLGSKLPLDELRFTMGDIDTY